MPNGTPTGTTTAGTGPEIGPVIGNETRLQLISLGPEPLDYEEVRALQLDWVAARAADKVSDTVFFLEHQPVVTQGRGLQFTGQPRERHMPLPKLPTGIAFAESERGGDLTYHGPGQLVIYPLLHTRDVAGTLRGLERAVIAWLQTLGLKAHAHEDATGVWVETASSRKKIGSIGIAVRKWVTYHGAAINIVNDLAPFHLISPCGFNPEVMTRLSDLTEISGEPGPPASGSWRSKVEIAIATQLSQVIESRETRAARNDQAPQILHLTVSQARELIA